MHRQVKHSRRYDGYLQSLTVFGEREVVVYAASEGEYDLGTEDSPVKIVSSSGVIYVNDDAVPTVSKVVKAGVKITVRVTVGATFRYYRNYR